MDAVGLLIDDTSWTSEKRVKLLRQGKTAGRHMIDERSPAAAHRVGSNGALMGQQAQADKTFGQFAVSLLAQQFLASLASPEINAADLEKLARGAAKKMDQGDAIGALRRLRRNPQQKLLKAFIPARQRAAGGGWGRITSSDIQRCTAGRHEIPRILTSD